LKVSLKVEKHVRVHGHIDFGMPLYVPFMTVAKVLGGAACVKLIGAWDAIAKRDILGHIVVERGGSGRRRADEIFS